MQDCSFSNTTPIINMINNNNGAEINDNQNDGDSLQI